MKSLTSETDLNTYKDECMKPLLQAVPHISCEAISFKYLSCWNKVIFAIVKKVVLF